MGFKFSVFLGMTRTTACKACAVMNENNVIIRAIKDQVRSMAVLHICRCIIQILK